MVDSTDGGVRSVTRALDLLGHFTETRTVWPVSDLARASGLPKTTVVRLVATLTHTGMLWERPDGQITVGAGLLRWARLTRAAWELPAPVREVMRSLARDCGETVNLVRAPGHRAGVRRPGGGAAVAAARRAHR